MAITREQILAARTLKREEIQIPELGGSIFVREMTASERDAFEASHSKMKYDNFRARYVAATVCDEAGKLLFGIADWDGLGLLPASVMEKIVSAAAKLGGETVKGSTTEAVPAS